jgi:hypothetical protein
MSREKWEDLFVSSLIRRNPLTQCSKARERGLCIFNEGDVENESIKTSGVALADSGTDFNWPLCNSWQCLCLVSASLTLALLQE